MDRIKECFDQLPIGVCFFDKNSVVRLINHRMLSIVSHLRKNGVQTLAELEHSLQSPPTAVCCLNPLLQIYRFPDGKMLRFGKERITTKAGVLYTQITAADVTGLMQRQNQLKEENAKLEEANQRLRTLFEQMPQIIREEETLAMKLRVHDDIGHSILAARRALLQQASLEQVRASAALWERSIAVLYRSNQMTMQLEPLEGAKKRANQMGVKVLQVGDDPPTQHLRRLCAWQEQGCMKFSLTNNGAPPEKEITEGGGLSMLRHHVEKVRGRMEIQSLPRFELMLSFPEEEETAYESDDR